MAKSKSKRVFARIVSLRQLIIWQTTAVLVGIALNTLFIFWQHELTRAEIGGMIDKTAVALKVCGEISWSTCLEIRNIVKEHRE